eukprot:TRINITY_DN2649_c0_g1_i3.p2 TRINITY_DN2649_c0_g1~~TRINITY_DN2649_c0_g1_i3.p2  ORF type:complete len:107 (-),score=37.98 TRINITY_DN2649_c0_g1_i3:371-691(-)
MRSAVAAALAALLLAGSVESLAMQGGKQMDAHQCKSLCQRFGMKALAKKNPAFVDVHNPTACCGVCDKEYGAASLLQVRSEPKAAPQPAAPTPKGDAAAQAAPVKR